MQLYKTLSMIPEKQTLNGKQTLKLIKPLHYGVKIYAFTVTVSRETKYCVN